jgi:Dolichyl-phosphate-mannose-protein mannosyltransferase
MKVVAAAAILILTMAGIEIAGAIRDSQTNDEGAHLVSGYCEWTLHDFRLDPAYPPFAKLLQSFPLLFLRAHYTPPPVDWARADEFGLGRDFLYHDFLYHNGAPWRPMLLSARMVTVACTVALAILVFVWGRARYGAAAALMALALLALDPGVLAHGHFATSDVPVTLFLFAAWVAWDAWLRRPATATLLAAGVLAALAVMAKYSALIVVAIFPVAWLLARPRPRIPLWPALTCLVAAPALVILSMYGFDTRSAAQDPILAGRVHGWFANIPLPAYYFWRGFQLLYRFGHGGHISYFLGNIQFHATPLYFPVGFFVKMPVATLAVCAWAAVLALSQRVPIDRGLASLLAAAALIFAMGIVSPLDIGFRHVMPMFPFLFIFCAAVITAKAGRFRGIAAGALMALLAIESLAYTPDFLPFFNFAAGGPKAGHRYLLDSNVDWGQDLNRLADWVTANHPRSVCLSYFGTADPKAYGIDPVLIDRDPETSGANCDVAAISQEIMYGAPGDRFRLLRMRQPDAMAGMLYIHKLR